MILRGIAKLSGSAELIIGWRMNIPSTMPRLKGFRHPREIIAYERCCM
jgi:putative transposase